MATRETIVKELCEKFRGRCHAASIKGKKRDAAALEYFVGAAMALSLAGQGELADAITSFISFGVVVRGAAAVDYELGCRA
jgi:hypothetical protein